MVILITGASHTGKTLLAQKLLETYHFPYLSLDLLKMGLIRSGHTNLTPEDDNALQAYLWPIAREMIKTTVENRQNLIVEGCYIPFGWEEGFSAEYLKEMRYYCLVMSRQYIESHFIGGRCSAFIGQAAVQGADNAGGDGLAIAQSVADGHHLFSHPQLVRVAHSYDCNLGESIGGQVGQRDFQNRQVNRFVSAAQLGLIDGIVHKTHGQSGGILHHMGIGHNVKIGAVVGDDDTGTAAGCLLQLGLTGAIGAEPVKKVLNFLH